MCNNGSSEGSVYCNCVDAVSLGFAGKSSQSLRAAHRGSWVGGIVVTPVASLMY